MPVKIGQNASIFANRGSLDSAAGSKIAALKRAIREARDFKLMWTSTEAPRYQSCSAGSAGTTGVASN